MIVKRLAYCAASALLTLYTAAGHAGEPSLPTPGESTSGLTASAAAAREDGDAERALSLYQEALRRDANDIESLCAIGDIYAAKGNSRLAARAYARAVQLEPTNAHALQGLGLAYVRLDNREAGQALLERAIASDADSWRAHNILGFLADMQQDYASAIEHYSVALALDPDNASVLNNRGYSRYLAGDLREAEQDLVAATAADADNEQAWRNLGLVYAHERKYGLAMHALRQVTSEAAAANDVGYIAMQDDDYDAADILFAEAQRLAAGSYPIAEQNVAELSRRRARAERQLSSANLE